MPSYIFNCKKCNTTYEDLVSYDATGKYKSVKCPNCHSSKKVQLATACLAITFKNAAGTSKTDSFSYVAGHNMEMAKKSRRIAEEKSHVGSTPYNKIDDVSSGNFGIY